ADDDGENRRPGTDAKSALAAGGSAQFALDYREESHTSCTGWSCTATTLPFPDSRRLKSVGRLVYRWAAAQRNSESSLCRAQAPNPMSAARPSPNHRPRKNISPGSCPVRMEVSESTSAMSAKATQGKTNMRAMLPLAARFGFFETSA